MYHINLSYLEHRVRQLLSLPTHSLSETAADQCSEVARVCAHWILEVTPTVQVFIMKGVGIFGDGERAHELVMVKYESLITLIDPTIWQFFPDAQSMLLVDEADDYRANALLMDMYGGIWGKVEEVFYDGKERLFLEKTIRKNMKEYFS